jgi:ATP-binding cassette, subfamily B, bacterial
VSDGSTDAITLRDGLRVLGRAIREEPRVFAVAFVGSAVYGAATVGAAAVIGAVTNRVIVPAFAEGRTTVGALAGAATAIVGVAIIKVLGIIARRIGAGVMQYRLQAAYRRRVTRQYLRLPLSWHQAHPTGALLSNANADVESAWYPIAPFPMAVGVIVMLIFAVVSMLASDLWLAAAGLLVFPAVMLVNVAYQRMLAPLEGRALALRAELSGIAHESFDGALVVKTLGRETQETTRFARTAHQLRDVNMTIGRYRGLFDPVIEGLPTLGIVTVLLLGAVRVESGAIDAGTVVEVAYLLTVVAFPIRAIGWVLGELPRSVVGFRRVKAVLDATGALPYGARAIPRQHDPARLELAGVGYAYADGRRVVDRMTLTVRSGSTVAVVGPTGSGKSTLAGLVVRLVDPVDGSVTLDGADLRELEAGQVPANVALVPQQAFLFDDTVRGNVTLDAPYSDDDVRQALRLAQADRFVAALPEQLDTMVGERGATLSGGQRQRLALARALIRRPRLLVLDDATSAVDPHVEQRILAGLRSTATTVVVVAYRRATIALADEVIYIEQGRLLDRGTHAELLDRSAGYRELVTAYEREAAMEMATEDVA